LGWEVNTLGLFTRIRNSLEVFRRNISISELDNLIEIASSGQPSRAGVNVSADSAMNLSAVFNAVQIIAGSIASLPLVLYKRVDPDGKERYTNHPLYDVLHNLPNPEMTSYTFRETLQAHLLLHGNCFAEIIRDTTGRVVQLWPWNPMQVEVKRADDSKIYYILKNEAGQTTRAARDILHIPGLGFDGRVGYSVVTKARESMGLGLAMEEFQARFYGQGTNLGAVLSHPGKLSDEAHGRLKKDVNEKYAGLGESHKVMVLEEGMTYEKTGMPLEDAQFLESRVFAIGDIARWFNLPPHKLKELSRATFSNIEHQQVEFVQDTMRPWAVRWEQHLAWKLLSEEERRTLFAEFSLDGLLRGDTKSRMEAYKLMRDVGAINADEIRAKENINPIGGLAGSMYWRPLNMGDAAKKQEAPAKPKEPTKEEEPEEKPEEKKLRAVK
jgi:HK97 family phage portal protein